MAGRFVRSSKYRHVFGRSTKKEQCYDGLRISKNAWDTNLIKANPSYISVNWEASGGGAFAVLPVNERGRLPEAIPLFRGHTAAVLDTDWSPFDDSLIASGSDDSKVFLWKVPDGFSLYSDAEEPQDVAPVAKLTGHSRKVGHVLFNPSAANVLASSSGDYTIRLWDIEAGKTQLTLKHNDIVQSLSWSAVGNYVVTTCRDKKLRIWDARQQKPVIETPGHQGAKNSRAVWMGEHDRIATTGFSRMSDRQLGLWDIKNPKEPLGGFQILDTISGVCMPFWDEGCQILYLAGKGDGNIRYFEYENDKFEYLSEYRSPDPQRGIAFLPKRGVNVHECEVSRAFKTVNDNYIEPIPFIVPRRAEVFQGDIYPPTTGLKPSMSAKEWFSGKDGLPPKISLEDIYEGQEPAEVPSDYKPSFSTPITSPPPTKTRVDPEPPKPAPAAVAQRGPPPTVKDNKESISSMANKFADHEDEESSSDDDSSFEEVPKPVERPSATTARMEEKTRGPPISKEPTKSISPTAASRAHFAAQTSPTPIPGTMPSGPPVATPASTTGTAATNAPPSGGAAGPSEGLRSFLHDIKSALENQTRMLAQQGQQIQVLTAEMDTLKRGLSGGGDRGSREKDERIRQLELELEEARSQLED